LYKTDQGTFAYPSRSFRRTRTSSLRYFEASQCPNPIPQHAVPCTILKQGSFILYQGHAGILSTTPNAFSSFLTFVKSLQSKSWIFDHIQIDGLMCLQSPYDKEGVHASQMVHSRGILVLRRGR
jgi:hypothetical protein